MNLAFRLARREMRSGLGGFRLFIACLALGVGPGDRVVAYLPNIPQTVVAFLATVSVGAIWSVCSPSCGARRRMVSGVRDSLTGSCSTGAGLAMPG